MTIFILSNYHQYIYFQKVLAILYKNLWLAFFISAVVCVKWQFNERIPIFLLPVWRLVLMIFSPPAVLWTCHMWGNTLIHDYAKNLGFSPYRSHFILLFMRLTFIFRKLRVPCRAEASSCWPCCSWRADRKKEIKRNGAASVTILFTLGDPLQENLRYTWTEWSKDVKFWIIAQNYMLYHVMLSDFLSKNYFLKYT